MRPIFTFIFAILISLVIFLSGYGTVGYPNKSRNKEKELNPQLCHRVASLAFIYNIPSIEKVKCREIFECHLLKISQGSNITCTGGEIKLKKK